MKRHTSYLALGSNVGNRSAALERAIRILGHAKEIKIEKVSSIYESSPVGPAQRDFLNCAVKVKTTLPPIALLTFLKQAEKNMGRKAGIRWGPRAIDLDILIYEKVKMKLKLLTLPHPELHKRKFVLKPLSEIAPRLKVPGFGRSVAQILSKLTDPSQKVRLCPRTDIGLWPLFFTTSK